MWHEWYFQSALMPYLDSCLLYKRDEGLAASGYITGILSVTRESSQNDRPKQWG